jgi:DNA adenine methylase
MNKAKPFLKWAGGKKQLLSQFDKLFPSPEEYTRYIEPFIGGGAVFFHLQPKKAIIADLNKDLINTYKVIKKETGLLIKILESHEKKHSKEFYLEVREKFNKAELGDTYRAAALIYLNKAGFNGLYRVNKSGGFNVPFGDNKKLGINPDNIRLVNKALKATTIKNAPFSKVINYAKKDDFIYFDPPYYPLNKTSSFTTYTNETFLEKEQEELAALFKKLDKMGCKVMLSNSDTKFIRDLYRGYDIQKVYARRYINSAADKRGKIAEVVVRNYK